MKKLIFVLSIMFVVALSNLNAAYCAASGSNQFVHITRVAIGTIDNSTGGTSYSDFTAQSTSVTQGETNVSITTACNYSFGFTDLGVWIDWNQDEDFADADEDLFCVSNGNGTYYLDVPSGATLGNTRMRVRIKYTGDGCHGPCGTTGYGEVEDYTIEVLDDEPVPVTLSEFTAEYAVGNLALYWTTQTETDNSGWNIYRGENQDAHQNDESMQINPVLVPGAGTSSEPTDYIFVDENEVTEGSTYWYWIESINNSGQTETFGPISLQIPVAGENPDDQDFENYGLFQNYPNPLSNSTSISFNLPEVANCELTIYNIKGEMVRTFSGKNVKTGEFNWDGKDENGNDVFSGIYLYKLEAGDKTYIKKMILTK